MVGGLLDVAALDLGSGADLWFSLEYVREGGIRRREPLAACASERFEEAAPVRSFRCYELPSASPTWAGTYGPGTRPVSPSPPAVSPRSSTAARCRYKGRSRSPRSRRLSAVSVIVSPGAGVPGGPQHPEHAVPHGARPDRRPGRGLKSD